MTNKTRTPLKSWWNRPLVGSVSLIERIVGALNPQPVPELALSLHDTEWEELGKIVPTLTMLDNEQYTSEFLFYISIKNKLEQNLDDYKGLQKFIRIFSFAIKNIHHFRVIRRIELDFQGRSQLELYNFVEEQLHVSYDPILFHQLVSNEIQELLEKILNEPTQKALLAYKTALDAITQEEVGLNLLLLFKKYNIADYAIFSIVNDILKQLKKQDLDNLKALVLIVKVNYDELEKLGQLIGIPNHEDKVITYAKIIQYIALSYRYENIVYRFQQLLENLQKWYKHYETVIDVRHQYPNHKYKISPKFMENIPGELIYLKYRDFIKI
ncbi:hypothetical protein [Geminocystis sp. NIES-3709]|uniref:hypothetical protein n=1 Tax=Geminocystis sp. NIES-3709 TaxID=1617448 RepID=UPI0005FC4AA3|nr:hypothetical protein [Geminocystis sp. NIES-3709]BAQ63860.1 hypothetical protein GM3709_625 [Geminocystis sp. NIES-3709]